MVHYLRLLLILLLMIVLAACSSTGPATPSPTLNPLPVSTTQPTPTHSHTSTPEMPPGTPTPAPPPATSTYPIASAALLPSPTPSLEPTPTGMPILRYIPRDLVLAVAWSPVGDVLAVAAGESVRLVDAVTLVELRSLPVGAWAGSLAYHPDGNMLALAAKDGSVQLWRPATGQLICRIEAHHPGAKSVAFSPDGRWLASTGNDAYVRLWDVTAIPVEGACELTPTAEMIGALFSVPFAAFSPDGTVIASVDYQAIRLREVASQRLVSTIQAGVSIFSLAYSPDGQWLASGELGNRIRLWDVASGDELLTMSLPADPNDYIASVAFSPDGKLIAAGSSDGYVTLWNPASGQLLLTFTGHDRAVTGVAFNPNGRWLASGGLDATLRLWPVVFP